jgi:hypothetical protein
MKVDTKEFIASITQPPIPIENARQIRISSIENICARFRDKYKKKAIILIEKYKSSGTLSEKDITIISKAIYFSTFYAALNLKYNEEDCSGNKGCVDPFEHILNEVRSFGLEESTEADCDYFFPRLSHPAFWFGERKLFIPKPYSHKDNKRWTEKNSEIPFIWQPRNSSSTSRIEMEYARKFNHYRDYFAANLETVLDSNR